MNDFEIIKEKSCACTGHRDLSKGIDKENLFYTFVEIIQKGFDTFLVGMAVGFDMTCFKILEVLRNTYNVKIVACVPCKGQSNGYGQEEKVEYNRMINCADKVVYISEERYSKRCMMDRNMFMIDHSSILIAYLKEKKGGTYNTVKYAESKKCAVVYVN